MFRLFFYFFIFFFHFTVVRGIFERQIYRVDKTTLKEETDIKT